MIRSRSFFNDIVKREEATPYSVVSLSEAEKGEIKEGKKQGDRRDESSVICGYLE